MTFTRLVLIGFMGAGKTTVGRQLAERLGWEFVDTDALIEELSGRTIPELFAEGEPFFRQWERQAIATLFAREKLVIAAGGGAVTDEESRGFLAALGPNVRLDAPVEVLWERAGRDPERPLAKDPERFHALYAARRPIYDRYPLTLDTGALTSEAAVSRLHDLLTASAGCLQVELGDRSYAIHVEAGALSALPRLMGDTPTPCLVVSDDGVAPLYAEGVLASLRYAHYQPTLVTVPQGEASKSFEMAQRLYDAAVKMGLKRHHPVIALGGGVVGDLAGFVAATYQRGVPFIQVPTTLLAQIDSSVGGKVAINHPGGKNLIGAFYQPKLVLADPLTLLSLPDREYRAGLAEMLKYGVIMDAPLFARLEAETERLNALDLGLLAELIRRCCELKAEVVAEDEREEAGGRRAILNFGHTIGHAIEAVAGYGAFLHGEAVAIGMVVEGAMAVRMGLWSEAELARLKALMVALKLPTEMPEVDDEEFMSAMRRDKKNRDAGITFVLPTSIGTVEVRSVPASEVENSLKALDARRARH